ncbi:MAG TPA: hypothetical protein VGI81_00115 [Tepidisphaeraceae bacterium]
MHVAPSILKPTFASLLLLVAMGCQQQHQGFSEAEKADIRDSWYPKSQQVIQPGSTEVAEGAAPLIYQVPTAGNVQVTDTATGQPLAIASVPHGTIIRIDQEKGIYAGSRQLRPGPLEPGQRYGIQLAVPHTNEWQSRVEAPRPAPPPATRPANEKQNSGPLF